MKGRVETGDLGDRGKASPDDPHGLEVVGLMQGRERYERLECLDRRVVDENRAGKGLAAVHDAMPDAYEFAPFAVPAEPRDEVHERFLMPDPFAGFPGLFVHDGAVGTFRDEAGGVREVPRRAP